MSNLTQTVRAKLVSATNPKIYNLSMATANTEYSQSLTSGTKKILVRMRTLGRARFAFVVGGTTGSWITIEAGAVYSQDTLDLNGATIYLQSNVAGQVAEILEWT